MNEYVAGKVSLPGLLLQLFGVAVILSNLAGLIVWFALTGLGLVMTLVSGDMEVFVAQLMGTIPSAITGLGIPIGTLIAGVLMLLGGSRLKGTSGAGLVYAGAICAMIPCCSGFTPMIPIPCCCLGAAVGIWVIVTMQDEQVKAAFAEAG